MDIGLCVAYKCKTGELIPLKHVVSVGWNGIKGSVTYWSSTIEPDISKDFVDVFYDVGTYLTISEAMLSFWKEYTKQR